MGRRTELFADEPEDTREAIMLATYDALSKHGYADLTIQRIGDEFDKSKSLLYHHYDGKDALLVDFLAFMLRRMEQQVPIDEGDTADEQLRVGFDHFFDDLLDGDDEAFLRALTELRAQACHDETYREQFTENDAFLENRLVEIIEQGIEQGVFREVDADRVASMVATTFLGAMTRNATADTDAASIQAELSEYLRTRLLADDARADHNR
ncbi:TetR/AcrR family transcriptional regulator [Halorientalis litorea]|jgi:AcrR family transcriptional regulator|uniref:TetR/AcrR family transcriptional regulator n=1 Tax=Halorientalis litorea TaxID=2931977 RepID=UPI001FF6F5E9|nr:TetR/AcrR family transcriptional regulator [Halorientalis litorea]